MEDFQSTLSLKLTAQNSNPRVLEVMAFPLDQGQWDPNAQPVTWQQIAPGTTGCWLTFTNKSPGVLIGSIEFVLAQAGTLEVTWNLSLTQPFAYKLTKNLNDPKVDASLVVNQGDYLHLWIQLIISIVTIALPGETVADMAQRFNTSEAVLRYLNGLPGQAELVAGQTVLVAAPPVGGSPLCCSGS
jgi:hypothetical protein